MQLQRLTENDYQVTSWSGGQTTQFYLSPTNGQYRPGNFDYRISSATVELDTTEFTPLPGYNRIILPLQNQLTLENNSKTITLAPFQKYYFAGDDRIISHGKCVDFNLIYSSDLDGHINFLIDNKSLKLKEDTEYICYFLHGCSVIFKDDESMQSKFVSKNDSLYFKTNSTSTMFVTSAAGSSINPMAILVWTSEKESI
ncbi:HutD family protein [Companilactobacillus insicii]|uniref:HutD family protein n=1 Tax=Companilactobacillus insicii TaxID=1732567 RepID=UPI000F7700B6|nr:HutD family protein [Companilactobacillus insicii]